MNTKIPVILSKKITELSPRCFWFGGGEIDTKIRIGVKEFVEKYDEDIFIGDIVYDESCLQDGTNDDD